MENKDYRYCTAKDFATDEYFQQWVLHGDISSNHFWETWISEHPEKEKVIKEATALVRAIGFKSFKLTENEKDQLWDVITEKLSEEDSEENIYPWITVKRNNKWRSIWKYAAASVILIAVTFGLKQFIHHPVVKPVSFSVQSNYGEIKRVWLPDSSEVVLNANSELVYTVNDKAREVWLSGEGYFKVRHTGKVKAFIVHTHHHISVDVLGTQFDVNTFGKQVTVALQNGKIRMNINDSASKREAQLYLKPGEMVSYDKQSGNYAKSEINTNQLISWTEDRLVMNNYSLKNVSLFMKQIFGKDLIISNPKLLEYHVSGSMPISYNLDTMLVEFQQLFNVKFRQEGNGYIVLKK